MRPHLETSTLDKYLPDSDIREYHDLVVPGPVDRAFATLRKVDFSRSRLVRTIFGIRTLPSFFRHQPWGTPKGPFVEQALGMGWVILEESPTELVAGAVTQPWAGVVKFTGLSPEDFRAFAEPGFVKIVWGFSARQEGPDTSRLITETRAQATDATSRARFLRYWFFVSPGIRLIRRVALRIAKRDLESARWLKPDYAVNNS